MLSRSKSSRGAIPAMWQPAAVGQDAIFAPGRCQVVRNTALLALSSVAAHHLWWEDARREGSPEDLLELLVQAADAQLLEAHLPLLEQLRRRRIALPHHLHNKQYRQVLLGQPSAVCGGTASASRQDE